MTPQEEILQSVGIIAPGVTKLNGSVIKHDPLAGMSKEQLIRMVHALQVENHNMRRSLVTHNLLVKALREELKICQAAGETMWVALERQP